MFVTIDPNGYDVDDSGCEPEVLDDTDESECESEVL